MTSSPIAISTLRRCSVDSDISGVEYNPPRQLTSSSPTRSISTEIDADLFEASSPSSSNAGDNMYTQFMDSDYGQSGYSGQSSVTQSPCGTPSRELTRVDTWMTESFTSDRMPERRYLSEAETLTVTLVKWALNKIINKFFDQGSMRPFGLGAERRMSEIPHDSGQVPGPVYETPPTFHPREGQWNNQQRVNVLKTPGRPRSQSLVNNRLY